ncbi:hypothetical protein [Pedomonas mirosovicensis]|uniref:hypothetical protein n=1 Tax=Pedomonas mirosovicensis TaxID=2908641 RepID=UPI0021694B05|nr:hypothetical protein [Pedomonas mirosovicensis]MCH8686194.1 hypothetical protein [Pedomonas mirosovicensis]
MKNPEPTPPRPQQGAPQSNAQPEYSAEDVRGGEIILRTRTRRIIFIAGLAGIVVLAFLIRIFAS